MRLQTRGQEVKSGLCNGIHGKRGYKRNAVFEKKNLITGIKEN